MGTKTDPGEFDCYGSAKDDEPIFILRASDEQAPDRVIDWANDYRAKKMANSKWTLRSRAKYDEALGCAKAMRRWLRNNR